MLFNCQHIANKVLTPRFIEYSSGEHLHQFQWLSDELIGALPIEWNWLPDEYGCNSDAKLIHYTLGTPMFAEDTPMSEYWNSELDLMQSDE